MGYNLLYVTLVLYFSFELYKPFFIFISLCIKIVLVFLNLSTLFLK